MKQLKVLVACEESQRVCTAFRNLGHEAYSCDLIEPSGGHPEWHILGDALKAIRAGGFETMDKMLHFVKRWDLIIAHPPCTYLSNAGACRLYPKAGKIDVDRYNKGLEGKAFFMEIMNASCDHIALENPIPSKIFNLPKYSQIIQPYQFGEPWSKKRVCGLKNCQTLNPQKLLQITSRMYLAGQAETKETVKKLDILEKAELPK